MAIDGDDVGGFDYWGDFVRDAADLASVQRAAVDRYAAAALGNLGAGAAETYHGPVLFSPAEPSMMRAEPAAIRSRSSGWM